MLSFSDAFLLPGAPIPLCTLPTDNSSNRLSATRTQLMLPTAGVRHRHTGRCRIMNDLTVSGPIGRRTPVQHPRISPPAPSRTPDLPARPDPWSTRHADQSTRPVPARRLVSFHPKNLNPHRIMERLRFLQISKETSENPR